VEVKKIIYVHTVDVNKNIVKIEARMEIKKYAKDEKKTLTTRDIIKALQEDFVILEILKESKISNWEKSNSSYTRDGVWEFKIKRKRKPQTPKVQKEEKKTGPKPSIRGRMSKIAKEKLGNS